MPGSAAQCYPRSGGSVPAVLVQAPCPPPFARPQGRIGGGYVTSELLLLFVRGRRRRPRQCVVRTRICQCRCAPPSTTSSCARALHGSALCEPPCGCRDSTCGRFRPADERLRGGSRSRTAACHRPRDDTRPCVGVGRSLSRPFERVPSSTPSRFRHRSPRQHLQPPPGSCCGPHHPRFGR